MTLRGMTSLMLKLNFEYTLMSVIVALLVELLLPASEIQSSKPVNDKVYLPSTEFKRRK